MIKAFDKAISYIDMSRHDLPAVPICRYEFNKNDSNLCVFINNIKVSEINGSDAIELFQIVNGERKYLNYLTVHEVKLLAAECCGIDSYDIEKWTREWRVVLARDLCIYYFTQYKNIIQEDASILFERKFQRSSLSASLKRFNNMSTSSKQFILKNRFLRRVDSIHKKIKEDQ